MTTITDNVLKQIYRKGEFYNPASSHYDDDAAVDCDRCGRRNIKMSYGYKDLDLCLECVVEVKDLVDKEKKKIRRRPGSLKKAMMQRQFRPSSRRRLKMMQKQFRSGSKKKK